MHADPCAGEANFEASMRGMDGMELADDAIAALMDVLSAVLDQKLVRRFEVKPLPRSLRISNFPSFSPFSRAYGSE